MTTEDTEVARVKWADAVADVNIARDNLQAAKDSGQDDFTIDRLQFKLDDAAEAAEAAYRAYGEAMKTWTEDAPRRWDYVMVPSTASVDDSGALPVIVFGFRGGTEAPVTVAMIMPEFGWRKFQKELDQAISQAVRAARKIRTAAASKGNGKVST